MQIKNYKRIKLWLLVLTLLLVLLIFLSGAFILLVNIGGFGPLPSKKELAAIHNEEASLVYSADGHIIGKYFAENRTNIALDEVPLHLANALVATEDKRFFEHEGVDARSYLRVFFRSILMGDRSSGGGSTLTQQLVKNLYGRTNFGFLSLPVSKIKEAIIASRLEKIFTKEELILLYLNSVPFGENVFGIESAAHRFFNKATHELSIEESAVLIGMLKANTYFNPRLNPTNAAQRRNLILALMTDEGYLSEIQCDSLKLLPLALKYENFDIEAPAGYFVYRVKKQAVEILSELNAKTGSNYNIEKDGLRIYSTLNLQIHQMVKAATAKHLQKMQSLLNQELIRRKTKTYWQKQLTADSVIDNSHKVKRKIELFDWSGFRADSISTIDSLWHYHKMLHAAVLVTSPQTGEVRSWNGGNHYRYLPFDMVLSHRQIASTFKPIMYAAALESGFSPCSYLENEAKIYEQYNDWMPQNFDNSSTPDSLVALWYALAHSMNLPSVDLYFKLPSHQLENICYRMGLPQLPDSSPSVALGTADVSLYEIVRAYGAFANKGKMNDLVLINKIVDSRGKIIFERPGQNPQSVIGQATAEQITSILQRAINEGTGTKIRTQYGIKSELAGKTGTAHNYSNAWFVAFTPNLVIGTWVGASTPDIRFGSAYGSGSMLALPIAGEVLAGIEKNGFLRGNYFTPFEVSDSFNVLIDCSPYQSKGLKGFIERLVKPEKQREQKVKKEIKRIFRKLFKKE